MTASRQRLYRPNAEHKGSDTILLKLIHCAHLLSGSRNPIWTGTDGVDERCKVSSSLSQSMKIRPTRVADLKQKSGQVAHFVITELTG